MQRSTGFDEVADENGFVVVYPDGIRRTWNAGGCCETAMRENVDDVGFVNAMIDSLSEKLPIDPRRIYATGFSNGSMLSHRLACELSDQIASIAAVSGVIMIPPCTPESAVSVLVMHGTDDPRSLWEGGVGDKNPEKGVRESIPVTMQRLQDRYDCATTDRTFLQKNAVTCTERQCTGGVAVGLCRIEGGGHQWPGSKAVWPDRLGPVNTDISASRVIWEFFAAHPKPAVAEQAAPATRQTMQP
jgi:polyhydroxybutyrate depolymerase